MKEINNVNIRNVSILGIIICCIYFIVVITFVITSSINWLIIFDIVTMVSGIYFVFLILVLPYTNNINYKIIAIVFVSALMIFTNIAHIVNINSIRNIKEGINIPEYLKIGNNLSYVTIIEYLGWGIFLGLAFLFSSFGIANKQELKYIKLTLFVNSCLCIFGFFGWVIINENLWYIASLGYGFGTLVLCIELLIYEKRCKKADFYIA